MEEAAAESAAEAAAEAAASRELELQRKEQRKELDLKREKEARAAEKEARAAKKRDDEEALDAAIADVKRAEAMMRSKAQKVKDLAKKQLEARQQHKQPQPQLQLQQLAGSQETAPPPAAPNNAAPPGAPIKGFNVAKAAKVDKFFPPSRDPQSETTASILDKYVCAAAKGVCAAFERALRRSQRSFPC